MTQQVTRQSEQEQKAISPPLLADKLVSKRGIISLLVCISLLLLLFTGLLVSNLGGSKQLNGSIVHNHASSTPDTDQDDAPLSVPGNTSTPSLHLPLGRYVVYEQQAKIYTVTLLGGTPLLVSTPGYVYNRATPPLLTPAGQLLYSGDGLWLADIFDGTATQIASLPSGQVITSLVLSSDGSSLAWSTEPLDGGSDGNVAIYAGSLRQSALVYQHSIADCPCFRVFSFINGKGKQADNTLLLTDDRGDHHAVRYGLWQLDLADSPLADPQPLLGEDSQQGPLALSSSTNTLLYSSYEGFVPAPTDSSVPDDSNALSYANTLSLASVNSSRLTLDVPQTILPAQHNLSNSAAYHWVTTPLFSPDGHILVYVEFSSDAQTPFNRHNALYTVQISGTGLQSHISKPQLLATSTSLFIELGPWLDNQVLTFYSDGSIYALDIRSRAVTTIAHTGAYAYIIAVVG